MKIITCLFLLSITTIAGCSATNIDLRSSKSSNSPIIYSTAMNILGSKTVVSDWILGEVIRVNNKTANVRANAAQFLLDEGTYEIEMSWLATKKPLNTGNVTSNSTLNVLGSVLISGKEYKPNKTFIAELTVRNGYNYYVNLGSYLVNNDGYKIPDKLCISEAKKGSKNIKVAPAGNILPKNLDKIVACSK